MKVTEERESYIPLPLIIALILIGGGGQVAPFHTLVSPNVFPLWMTLILTLGFTFINSLVNSRALGEVGVSITVPSLREAAIIATGAARHVEVWLAPLYVGGAWASNFTRIVKVAYMTQTKPLDYVKAYITLLPLTWVMSFIVTLSFQHMAPIPSAVWGGIVWSWPMNVTYQLFMITNAPKIYKPEVMALGFGSVVLSSFLGLKVPRFDIMGMLIGITTTPNVPLSYIIGHLIGRIVRPSLERAMPSSKLEQAKGVILAGLACGSGLAIGICSTIVLISRAIWYTYALY